MNTNLKKIAKTAAVGIFFMALLMNVKVSLTDPFISISNDVVAQTNSSSSGDSCFVRTPSNCPTGPGGIGGGQRVTCDFSGSSVPGSTCTPVSCVTGARDPIYCN